MQNKKSIIMEELFTALLKPIIKESLREVLTEAEAERAAQEPKFLTRQQVAEMLGVSLVTVHSYINRGFLESKKIGHKTLFSEADVLKAIQGKKVYKFKHTED